MYRRCALSPSVDSNVGHFVRLTVFFLSLLGVLVHFSCSNLLFYGNRTAACARSAQLRQTVSCTKHAVRHQRFADGHDLCAAVCLWTSCQLTMLASWCNRLIKRQKGSLFFFALAFNGKCQPSRSHTQSTSTLCSEKKHPLTFSFIFP